MLHRNRSPIRELREAAGLTQIQLSLRARISLSRLRTAEAGVATTDTFVAIGRVFGIDPWKLRQLVEAENDQVAGGNEVQP